MARWWKDDAAVTAWGSPDEDKLAELILYVAGKIREDPTGGATKLNKILFFAEFSHVRAHGVPITGAQYMKLAQGPTPRRLVPIRDKLIAEGAAELQIDEYFGRSLHRLVPIRVADEDRFSDSEKKIVVQVVEACWGRSAAEVSEISHREIGWRIVNDGEDIPFSTAFLDSGDAVTDTSRRHAEQLAMKLGIAR